MADFVNVPPSVTVCITSCGRLDLLEQTLQTFETYNKGAKYIANEDSGDDEVIAEFKRRFPHIELVHSGKRSGIMASIDRIYSLVTTPYIFHLEDDWETYGPIDWEVAIALLEADEHKVANVCVRTMADLKEKYARISPIIKFHGLDIMILNPKGHPEYHGWSPNPGLIKKSLYDEFAPVARFLPDQLSREVKKTGRAQARMIPGVTRHLGWGRTIADPQLKPRPKSKILKAIHALKMKLYYAGIIKDPYK